MNRALLVHFPQKMLRKKYRDPGAADTITIRTALRDDESLVWEWPFGLSVQTGPVSETAPLYRSAMQDHITAAADAQVMAEAARAEVKRLRDGIAQLRQDYRGTDLAWALGQLLQRVP